MSYDRTLYSTMQSLSNSRPTASLTNMVTWNSSEISCLLNLIKERKVLYDTTNSEYNNRDAVWKIWNNIARELHKPPSACRDKWTRLRCVYRRIVNQTKIGKRKSIIRWQWLDDMSFLEPHLKLTPYLSHLETEEHFPVEDSDRQCSNYDSSCMTISAYTECEMENVKNEASAADQCIQAEINFREIHRENSDVENQSHVSKHTVVDTPRITSSFSQVSDDDYLHLLPSPTTMRMGIESMDSDVMFFMSLVPDIRQLPPRIKGEFKLKVQEMLQQMLYPSVSGGSKSQG